MKSENTVSMNKNTMGDLLKETKETLATGLNTELLNGNVRTFSVADMWNIRKKQSSSHILNKWLN